MKERTNLTFKIVLGKKESDKSKLDEVRKKCQIPKDTI